SLRRSSSFLIFALFFALSTVSARTSTASAIPAVLFLKTEGWIVEPWNTELVGIFVLEIPVINAGKCTLLAFLRKGASGPSLRCMLFGIMRSWWITIDDDSFTLDRCLIAFENRNMRPRVDSLGLFSNVLGDFSLSSGDSFFGRPWDGNGVL